MPIRLDLSKCTGCKLCQLACSAVHEGVFNPEKARLKIVHEYLDTGIHIAASFCTLCKKCEKACPEAAITNNGCWIRVDKDLCTGCGSCVEACPTHVVYLDSAASSGEKSAAKAIICDLCGGEPKCIEWCPKAVITLRTPKKKPRKVVNE
jgi:Fe-S-cluster-containing hydrogenase component 2